MAMAAWRKGNGVAKGDSLTERSEGTGTKSKRSSFLVFLAIAAVALVPLMVMTVLVYYYMAVQKVSAREYVLNTARTAKLLVSSYMADRVRDNAAWAELETVKKALRDEDSRDPATVLLQQLVESYGTYELTVLVDANGLAVCSSSPQCAGMSFAEANEFKAAMEGKLSVGQAHHSEIVKELNPDSRGWTLCIAVPVKGTGNMSGVLMSYLKWRPLEDLVASIRVGMTGYAYILDAKRRVVVHPNRQLYRETVAGPKIKLPVLDRAVRTKSSHISYEFKNIKTKRIDTKLVGLAYLKPHGNLGWVVGAGANASELVRSSVMARVASLSAVMFVAVLIASGLAARMIVRSFSGSTEGMERSPDQARGADTVNVESTDPEPVSDPPNDVSARLDTLERNVKTLAKAMRALKVSQQNKS